MRALLSYRPSLQSQDKDGNFPINLAAMHGHLECVKMLMSHGSLAFVGNKEFKNPLMLAAENGHFNVVEYLLNNNIKMVYQLNKMNESELTLASKNVRSFIINKCGNNIFANTGIFFAIRVT